MALMLQTKFKNILVISLSNIGDVILTLPVIDALKHDFPQARLSVVVGPKAAMIFEGNTHIHQVHVLHKRQGFKSWMRWVGTLRAQGFDCVVDLRHTLLPFVLGARHRTSLWRKRQKDQHMRQQHLQCLASVYPIENLSTTEHHLCGLVSAGPEQDVVHKLLQAQGLIDDRIVVMAPGSADERKQWPPAHFAVLADALSEMAHVKIVLIGGHEDRQVAEAIQVKVQHPLVNAVGALTLRQSAVVLRKASLAIGNDSAAMHMASYLNRPVITIFGPTNPVLYGPWSSSSRYFRRQQDCQACCQKNDALPHTCMQAVTPQEVLHAITCNDEGICLTS